MEVTHKQLDELKDSLEGKMSDSVKEIMNHVDTQVAGLQSGLQKHIDRDDARFKDVDTSFDEVHRRFDSYVSLKVFMWIFGLAMSVIVGLFGVIWLEIRATQDSVDMISIDSSYLRGQWESWTKE